MAQKFDFSVNGKPVSVALSVPSYALFAAATTGVTVSPVIVAAVVAVVVASA